MKDWVGNRNSIFKTLGATNHTDKEREKDDFYATAPKAIDLLLKKVELPNRILEPACGSGCLSHRLEDLGYDVVSADLVDRGYGKAGMDFLGCDTITTYGTDIRCVVTNPPYKQAKEFVKKSLELLPDGGLVCMFLKTTFAEGKARYNEIFSVTPPVMVLQCIERVLCAKNGEFEYMQAHGGSAVAYAWWIWKKGYKGKTILDWI